MKFELHTFDEAMFVNAARRWIDKGDPPHHQSSLPYVRRIKKKSSASGQLPHHPGRSNTSTMPRKRHFRTSDFTTHRSASDGPSSSGTAASGSESTVNERLNRL